MRKIRPRSEDQSGVAAESTEVRITTERGGITRGIFDTGKGLNFTRCLPKLARARGGLTAMTAEPPGDSFNHIKIPKPRRSMVQLTIPRQARSGGIEFCMV